MTISLKLLTAMVILSGENSPLQDNPKELEICRRKIAEFQKQNGLELIKMREAKKRKKK